MKNTKSCNSPESEYFMPPAKQDDIIVTKFTEDSAIEFRKRVKERSMELGPTAPIVIYIDSYGGNVDALASMIATMDEIPNMKITVCIGKAMSAGAILLSHGDVRMCDTHARIMIHKISSSMLGNADDLVNDVLEIDRLNSYWMKFLANNCGLELEQLNEFFFKSGVRELYFDAVKALEFGIIDTIGTPAIEPRVEFVVKGFKKENVKRTKKSQDKEISKEKEKNKKSQSKQTKK